MLTRLALGLVVLTAAALAGCGDDNGPKTETPESYVAPPTGGPGNTGLPAPPAPPVPPPRR
jgi:hypothetical protein